MEEYARILRGESEVYYSITKLAVYWYKASDMTRDMYRLLQSCQVKRNTLEK